MNILPRNLLLRISIALLPLTASAADTTFHYSLPAEYTTSAAAYDSNGVLVRTIWRRLPLQSGTFTAKWDGNDDTGAAVPPGSYTIKLLMHNVDYAWEGVIGNTGDSFTDGINLSLGDPTCMAIDGTNAILANGYSEAKPLMRRFSTATPNTSSGVLPPARQAYLSFVATDGIRFYVADTGSSGDTTKSTFVTAYNFSDNTPAIFSTSTSVTISSGVTFTSCIDLDQTDRVLNHSTALAVQKSGSILAVAHGPLNAIKLFDKTTGTSMGSISVMNPTAIAFAPSGDLWVITQNTAVRFTGVGSTNTAAAIVSGFVDPLAIAVHPTNSSLIIVADGGTEQKLKAFNSTGATLWTMGQTGGYEANGPAVAPDKFQFESGRPIPLAIQSDGSFWVRDNGSNRILHFNSGRVYMNQIACVRGYTSTVDLNNPTRVFGGNWLEYQVDYTKPLLPGDPQITGGNRSWKMVNNWTPPSSMPQYLNSISEGLATVVTLNNGRTYALCTNITSGNKDVMELTSSGLRPTGSSFSYRYSLYANGDLRHWDHPAGGIQTVYNQALSGFDASGNPIWGSSVVFAAVPGDALTPAYTPVSSGPKLAQFPITSSNVMISFNPNKNAAYTGMHLGGIQLPATFGAPTSTNWAWKSSPAVMTDVPMDGLGSFDLGDATTYGGNAVLASGRNVIFGYQGEFWKGTEACQNMHFYDDGLFVGQFGTSGDVDTYTTILPTTSNQLAQMGRPGGAGNAFSPSITRSGGECYYYSNDENTHGGIHRWHLVGSDAIQEMSGVASLGGSTTLSAPAPAYPYGITATPGSGQVTLSWRPVAGATNYRIRYGTQRGAPPTSGISVNNSPNPSTILTGLTNDTTYYFTLTATVAGVESVSSYEVSATPIDTTVAVHKDGQAIFSTSAKINTVSVTSANVGNGSYPACLHNMLSSIGLRKTNLGSNGYALYNWDGAGTNAINVAPGFSILQGSGWTTYNSHIVTNFILDGVAGVGSCLHTNTTGTINITVSDTNWHTLSVWSPPWGGTERTDVFTLTPQGLPTPAATFNITEPYPFPFVHLMQFKFKGNVTLTVQQLAATHKQSANISGLFID